MRIGDFFRWLNNRQANMENINWSGRAIEKKKISVDINISFNEISSLVNLTGDPKDEYTHVIKIRDIDFSARCIKTTADVDEAIRALQELKPKIEHGCTRNTIEPKEYLGV